MTDDNLLQKFWSLSSLNDEERVQAAGELIISLGAHQAAHEGGGLCAELEYSLKRLVRGLASNRKAARHGYFITLTEVLVQFPQVQLSNVYKLIHAHLESTGGFKGHEERGIYFGRVFALLALLRSGRLETSEGVLNVVKQICVCAQKKAFLQELCMVTVGQLISEGHFSDDVIRDHVIPLVGVTSGWEECTPERLYIILLLSKQFGKEKWFKEILMTKWSTKNIYSRTNFSNLASTLVGSSSSHPRLHSVWPLVLETVRGKGHFGEFWKTAVDESLFTSSHERKYVGFQLLEMILPSLSVGEVPLVFSPNLLRCLVNNASSQENYLHPAARHLLAELTSFLDSNLDQSLNITIMLHLQRRCRGKFDQLTDSKVIETILSQLDVGGVDLLVAHLQGMFCDPQSTITSEDSDEEGCGDAHSIQLWVLEQLVAVVRNARLPRADSWLLSIARFLLLHACFKDAAQLEHSTRYKVQAAKTPLEQVVVDSCSQKLTSILSDLSGLSLRQQPLPLPAGDRGGGGGRFGPPGVTKDGQFFLTELLKFAQLLVSQRDVEGLEHREPFDDESMKGWSTACEAVESLSSKEELCCEEKAFLLLYSNLGLQLLSPSEREGTTHSIEELKVCHGEMELAVGRKGRTPKKKRRQKAEEESGPSWIEVLTDMLLGFLSQPSQLWRNVTEQVFKLVSGHVTLASLQLILGVLEPKSNKEELMENREEEGEEEEASSDGSGGGGDSCNEGEGSGMDEDGRGSLVSGEDGGSDDDEAAEQGEEVDPVFRADVQRALGAAAVDSDAESESSLDDDAMMAVDDALAAVFRTRFALKHHRKLKKDEAKSVLHFKLRVLDLVELYIRKESTNPLVLDLVVPLYELIHAAQSQKESSHLVKRASGIFKNRLCHLKEYPKADFDVDHVHSHLQQMIQHLYKVNPQTVPLVTQGCMFLLRVLRGSSAPPTISPLATRAGKKRKREENEAAGISEGGVGRRGDGVIKVELVNAWVGDALHDFITRKNSNVPPSFFTTYIERYPTLASQLAPVMVQDLPSAANHFKKNQVMEMLITLNGMDLLGGDIVDKLTNEDAEVVLSATTKSKKRKRSKHKKQRTSDHQ